MLIFGRVGMGLFLVVVCIEMMFMYTVFIGFCFVQKQKQRAFSVFVICIEFQHFTELLVVSSGTSLIPFWLSSAETFLFKIAV